MIPKLKRTRDQIRHELDHQPYVETVDGKFVLFDDPMLYLEECHRFMMAVLSGGFDLDVSTDTRESKVQRNLYDIKLQDAFSKLRGFAEVYRPGFVYEPSIALFLQQYRKHRISGLNSGDWMSRPQPNGETGKAMLLDFIETLKSEAAIQGTRKKIADHKNKLAKNRVRLLDFEEKLFRRCSRPVIVRIDLEYKANRFHYKDIDALNAHLTQLAAREQLRHSEMYTVIGPDEPRRLPMMRVDLQTVQKDREKLFASMKGKPTLFRHLVGYVWRIEYGHRTGFHLHVLLAFHGAHVHKHEDLAQRIGEYWENEITAKQGRFHNCNRDWDPQAPTYGLGPIEWHDTRLRSNLRNHVLEYLVKPDQHVLARPYKGMKLIGSGFVHRDKPVRGGRPRSRTPRVPKPPIRRR